MYLVFSQYCCSAVQPLTGLFEGIKGLSKDLSQLFTLIVVSSWKDNLFIHLETKQENNVLHLSSVTLTVPVIDTQFYSESQTPSYDATAHI